MKARIASKASTAIGTTTAIAIVPLFDRPLDACAIAVLLAVAEAEGEDVVEGIVAGA
jgi:hypothetical protein